MGKKINIIADEDDVCLWDGWSQVFKDFVVTFAFAFRYYITGLIIGYFLCVIFKKCYSAWTFSRGNTPQNGSKSADPKDTDENLQKHEDGDRHSKKERSTYYDYQGSASSNLEELSSAKENHSALDYWKQCFDNFGFVVVDTLNPIAPFKHLADTGDSNAAHRSPITLRWEPSREHRDELNVHKSNKSSSTTDFSYSSRKNFNSNSKGKSDEINKNAQESSIDIRNHRKHRSHKRTSSKRRNKKLDTFGLRNEEMDKSDSTEPCNSPKNDIVLAVTKKLSTTGLKNTVESSLIPGKKVSKNAVIVLRLRDKQLSTCNVFNEEEVSLSPKKTLLIRNRNRNKKSPHNKMTVEQRNPKDTLKLSRDSGNVITSDENSSGGLEEQKKFLNLLSFSRFSKNHLHSPFSKRKNLSVEKFKHRTGSKKGLKLGGDIEGRRNTKSRSRHSYKQTRPLKADKNLQSQEFSKRRCFKYKNMTKKRQKIIENPSKQEIRSISQFLADLRKCNRSNMKQSVEPIWAKNEDVYQIEVNESVNGLRIRSRSRCELPESSSTIDKGRKSSESFHFKERRHGSEPHSSRSRRAIPETNHLPGSDEYCYFGNLFGSSNLSTPKTKKIKKGSSDHVENSDISTGSESMSSEDQNSLAGRKGAGGSGKVEELVLTLDESSPKNSRSQFWKIFGSKNCGKSS